MLETAIYQISQLQAAQEVELELDTNNWCSIRITHQTAYKFRITWFKWMWETKKYQISQLPAAQDVALELGKNNRCSIRKTHQATHKFIITWFI